MIEVEQVKDSLYFLPFSALSRPARSSVHLLYKQIAEVSVMNLFKVIGQALQFLTEGASEIFSPDRDEYPKTGVQPYEGDPLSERVESTK
ncbi:MAG: hypothetical protein Fur0046_09420 [Cyanobacteria bacterium J069]